MALDGELLNILQFTPPKTLERTNPTSECLGAKILNEVFFKEGGPGAGDAITDESDAEYHPRNNDSEFTIKTVRCRQCGGFAVLQMRDDASIVGVYKPGIITSIEGTCNEP